MAQVVQILKLMREYLTRQRDGFKSYLSLLEKEEEAILRDDSEKLEYYIRIEQSIVLEICTLQRVINPLEEIYLRAYPEKEDSIQELEDSLNRLKEKVLLKNKNNRQVLKERLESLRQEIKSLGKRFNSSPYARIGVPSMVDLTS